MPLGSWPRLQIVVGSVVEVDVRRLVLNSARLSSTRITPAPGSCPIVAYAHSVFATSCALREPVNASSRPSTGPRPIAAYAHCMFDTCCALNATASALPLLSNERLHNLARSTALLLDLSQQPMSLTQVSSALSPRCTLSGWRNHRPNSAKSSLNVRGGRNLHNMIMF